jgi:hypothetical protein
MKPLFIVKYEDKTLSINLINWIIKAVKDKKQPRWWNGPPTSWLLSWLSSLANFHAKKARIDVPGLVSVLGPLTKSTPPPLSRSPWQQKASRRPITCPIYWIVSQRPFQEWSQSCLASCCPRTLQDELVRGHADYCRRRIDNSISVVVWGLWQWWGVDAAVISRGCCCEWGRENAAVSLKLGFR